eukprot:scaffold40241_cov20-Tisochrysis_lutea.AAC.2
MPGKALVMDEPSMSALRAVSGRVGSSRSKSKGGSSGRWVSVAPKPLEECIVTMGDCNVDLHSVPWVSSEHVLFWMRCEVREGCCVTQQNSRTYSGCIARDVVLCSKTLENISCTLTLIPRK